MAKAKLTFMGGVHPYDGKNLSKDKPIKTVLPKGDLVYPLSQHIGAPAKPIVKKVSITGIRTDNEGRVLFMVYVLLMEYLFQISGDIGNVGV